MDRGDLSRTLYESASSVYDYITAMQYVTDPPMGVSSTAVTDITPGKGYAVLHLDSPLADTGGLILMVDRTPVDPSRVDFTRYDEMTRTIVLRGDEDLMERLTSDPPRLMILSDMRFLIKSAMDFFQAHGELISLPVRDPIGGEPPFPDGSTPSPEQVSAARNVLNNRLSYVWGAPGTGKTQMVLSTCLRAYLAAGRRVAVFAPTNNSVEQVLRGVFASFPDEEKRDVLALTLRLGMPTRRFLKEYPDVCEDRHAQRRLEAARMMRDNLMEVLFERTCDSLTDDFEHCRALAELHPETLSGEYWEFASAVSDIVGFCQERSSPPEDIRDWRTVPCGRLVQVIESILYNRQRPAKDIYEYDEMDDAEIMSSVLELESEMRSLRKHDQMDRLSRARIVAGTPQQFIARFRPRGSEDDGRPELQVDHIFLDEAGYCGLMMALPLFANGVPVTFLGDHMQLPPVCELDEEVLRTGIEKGNSMSLAFLWNMSALYSEQLITGGAAGLSRSYLESSDPVMRLTFRSDLTVSHRFGSNLATILDRHVYRNGLSGSSASGNLAITYIDAVCTRRRERENEAECEAVWRYLREYGLPPQNVAVLTPYTAQLRMLRSRMRRYRDSMMTVHGSQGREWDTVVLSVADNGVISRDVPFRFTSSSTEMGMKVINTAVSRAKKKLVLVCDRSFWMGREGELISAILAQASPEDVSGPPSPGGDATGQS